MTQQRGTSRQILKRPAVIAAGLALVTSSCVHEPIVRDGVVDVQAMQHLQDEIATRRGLPWRTSLRADVIDGDTLTARAHDDLQRQREHLRRETRVLRHLGMLGADDELDALWSDSIGTSAAGVYFPGHDDEAGTLAVVQDFDVVARAQLDLISALVGDDLTFGPILGHELVHALQDQHYDIDAMTGVTASENNADRVTAATWLLESDANIITQLQLNGARADAFVDRNAAIAYGAANYLLAAPVYVWARSLLGTPAWMSTTLLDNYTRGLPVLQRTLDDGGWPAVSELYRARRPESTEQLLFPERFFGDGDRHGVVDQPIRLRPWSNAPGALSTWRRTTSNVMGAYGMMLLFAQEQARPGGVADVAAGWGGDRYELFERDGRAALLWRTAWDTNDDAREFFAMLPVWNEHRFGAGLSLVHDAENARGWRVTRDGEATLVIAERRGDRVIVVDGVREEEADTVVAALWRDGFAGAARVPQPSPPASSTTSGNNEIAWPREPAWVQRRDTLRAQLVTPHRTMSARAAVRLRWDDDAALPSLQKRPILVQREFAWGVHRHLELRVDDGGAGVAIGHDLGPVQSVSYAGLSSWDDALGAAPIVVQHALALHPSSQIAFVVQGAGAWRLDDVTDVAARVRIGGGLLFQPVDGLVLSLGLARESSVGATLADVDTVELGAALRRGLVRVPTVELRLSGMVHAFVASTWQLDPTTRALGASTHEGGLLLRF